ATLMGDTSKGMPHYGFAAGACMGVATADGTMSPDKAYSFTPQITQSYDIQLTTANGYDGALYVVTDCANVGTTCVGAVDMACTNCTEKLSVQLDAGKTYYIIVDGGPDTMTSAGPYSLTVQATPVVVQIDVSSVLKDDTIVNKGPSGI